MIYNIETMQPYYPKGTTLSVSFDTYSHLGISDGLGGVVSASKKRGKIVHESEAVFSENKPITVRDDITSTNPEAAYEKIKSRIGETYNLLSNNCEHLVNWAHGLKVESKQFQLAVGVILIALFLYSRKSS